MGSREISAAVMVLGAVVISVWVAWDAMRGGVPAEASAAAWKMLWAIGYSILFNIVVVIIGVIAVSIARREEVKDERADERDRMIDGRANTLGYIMLSFGVLAVLIMQANGLAANFVPYWLFGIAMIAGGGSSLAKLVLYRVA